MWNEWTEWMDDQQLSGAYSHAYLWSFLSTQKLQKQDDDTK